MKKQVIVFLLMLSSLMTYSQVKFHGTFETGYEDRTTTITTVDPLFRANDNYVTRPVIVGYDTVSHVARYKNSLYGTLEFKGDYKGFSVYTNQKTYFRPNSLIRYEPLLIEFRIGAMYKYKQLSIGYEHMCMHSIDQFTFNGGYDRISVRLELF